MSAAPTTADDKGCRFGHHCRQRASPNSINYRGRLNYLIYMWVPKRANYQYRYGAAQYRYWYQVWYRQPHTRYFTSFQLSYLVNFVDCFRRHRHSPLPSPLLVDCCLCRRRRCHRRCRRNVVNLLKSCNTGLGKICARTPAHRAASIYQIHAAGGLGGSTTMVMVFVRSV